MLRRRQIARTEIVTITNMCMIYDGTKVLVQEKIDDEYSGMTFPGGHVEKGVFLMNECKFMDNKKACLLLAIFFWGLPIFIGIFGNTYLVKLIPRELLIEYIDPVFYGSFFLVTVIVFRKIFFCAIKDFVRNYEKYLEWSFAFVLITLILMVVSAIVLESAGVGDSSNQKAIDDAIVQYGLLQISA